MGLRENGTLDLESNMIEQSRISKDFAQDQRCEPENCHMNYERFDSETVEQKVTEAQNIEKKLVTVQGYSDKVTEVGLNHEMISQSEGKEKQEQLLANVKTFSVFGSLVGTPQNGLLNPEHVNIPFGTASINPSGGKSESLYLDSTNNFVHSENEVRELCGRSRKRKAKLKGPVISSWTLRSKSQEKPKAPEAMDAIKEGSSGGEKRRRGRKKKQMQKNTMNEFSRIRTHLRYLLHRINYEQNLIDAYSAEGWRGQSLEKLKPEKQLQQAKSHILRYKLKIRTLFQQLDMSLAVGKLPASLFDSQGEIDNEDIFCAKCGSKDLTLDNDIILCDGACERGFHQFCLEPPLLKNDIPPGDQSWLCPGCDCKVDCIDMLKDYQGEKIFHHRQLGGLVCTARYAFQRKRCIQVLQPLHEDQKIFPEAAAAAPGNKLDDGCGSSPDDSEDEEYDPDKPDADEEVEGDESSSDESSYFSASGDLAAPLDNEKYLGLSSDDSEDDDFDPSAPYQDEQAKQDSSSSDFTSDSEDLGALLEDETMLGEDLVQNFPSEDDKFPSMGSVKEKSMVGRVKRQPLKDELSYLMDTSAGPVSSRRHVERLDYKKLNDRLFASFNENQYPERAIKEKLAKELGLTVRQVSKWFDNTCWSFNDRPGMELISAERPADPQPSIGRESTYSNRNMGLQESTAVPAQRNISEANAENPVTNTSGENSGSRNPRKRKSMLDQALDVTTQFAINRKSKKQ